jgi:phosphoribulokinase
MADDVLRIARAMLAQPVRRPVMLGIAGDSSAGTTTLARGLADVLGRARCRTVCADDYRRYDRDERATLPFTALHPHAHHLRILEQHLQLLATGQPVLKPVYDDAAGRLARPELVEPPQFVIVEGLLPLFTRAARACFDLTVYVDPAEQVRWRWSIDRDTRRRGYSPAQVHAELVRREPEAEAFVRPQRDHADIVVSFAPVPGRADPPETPLSAEVLWRSSVPRPQLGDVLGPAPAHECARPGPVGLPPAPSPEQVAVVEALRCEQHAPGEPMHLKRGTDSDGRPVDVLHVHGYVPGKRSRRLQRALWSGLGEHGDPPAVLGRLAPDVRSEPLAIIQLLLLHPLVEAARARST